MHSGRKTPWMFGWNPPWHRKNMDDSNQQRSSQRHPSTDDDALLYNHFLTADDNLQLDMTTIDTGSVSPPLSSSSSSFTSGSRRNTKASILDFFHRRKSSTPSVLSLQQSSSVVPAATGQKPTLATNPSFSVFHQQSTSYAGHYSLSCSPPTFLSDNTITATTASSPPSLHSSLHRRTFIHNPNDTNNSNMSPPCSPSSSAISDQLHRPSSLLSPPSYHLPSPLSPPPPHHHLQSSALLQPSHHRRIYATLIKKHSSALYEQPTFMEDTSRPTRLKDNIERITLGHELVKLALDGLFTSPLESSNQGEQVLQIGSGNGSWCLDYAKEHPRSFVIGLDDRLGGSCPSVKKNMILSAPIDKNYMFIKTTDSIASSLKRFPENHFDLVYGHFLALALSRDAYESLVVECWRVCKPGGFVEFTELDLRILAVHSRPFVQDLNHKVVMALQKKNLDPRLPRHLQDLFFKLLTDQRPDERQKCYHVNYNSLPLGVWGGRLGVMVRDDLRIILDTLGVATMDAASDAIDDALDAHRAFMNLYQIFVQKPCI